MYFSVLSHEIPQSLKNKVLFQLAPVDIPTWFGSRFLFYSQEPSRFFPLVPVLEKEPSESRTFFWFFFTVYF